MVRLSGRQFILLLFAFVAIPSIAWAQNWWQVHQVEFQHSGTIKPPTEGPWKELTLPDQWIKDLRWEQGLLGWYRIELPDRPPDELQALYLQRISTNVRVY